MKNRTVKAVDVVQIALLPSHVPDVEHQIKNFGDCLSDLCELAKDGYNLTISWDSEREQFSARLAGIEQGCVNAGRLLYANSKDVVTCLAALHVKHFLVSEGKSWSVSVRETLGFS